MDLHNKPTRQTEIQRFRDTERQPASQPACQTNSETASQSNRQIDRQTDKQTDRQTDRQPHIDVLLSSKSTENSVRHILHQCLDPDQSMNDLLSNTKRLQHHQIDKVTKAQVHILLGKESGKNSARLRSLQGKGAGSWLNATPSTQNLAILLEISAWRHS